MRLQKAGQKLPDREPIEQKVGSVAAPVSVLQYSVENEI